MAAGISEPMPVAAALASENAAAPGSYVLDTLATVVDASRFLADVAAARALSEVDVGAEEGDSRTLADLLVEQARPAQAGVCPGCGVGDYGPMLDKSQRGLV